MLDLSVNTQSVVWRDKILNGFKALFRDSVAGDTFDSVQLFFFIQ